MTAAHSYEVVVTTVGEQHSHNTNPTIISSVTRTLV